MSSNDVVKHHWCEEHLFKEKYFLFSGKLLSSFFFVLGLNRDILLKIGIFDLWADFLSGVSASSLYEAVLLNMSRVCVAWTGRSRDRWRARKTCGLSGQRRRRRRRRGQDPKPRNIRVGKINLNHWKPFLLACYPWNLMLLWLQSRSPIFTKRRHFFDDVDTGGVVVIERNPIY